MALLAIKSIVIMQKFLNQFNEHENNNIRKIDTARVHEKRKNHVGEHPNAPNQLELDTIYLSCKATSNRQTRKEYGTKVVGHHQRNSQKTQEGGRRHSFPSRLAQTIVDHGVDNLEEE
mmetsp:Transcript_23975/g.49849  ORF Transcript_23975/g.49849 Transcript_23975/m.49849 type:complete len:118 (-) Transcript_23975:16-369(-)